VIIIQTLTAVKNIIIWTIRILCEFGRISNSKFYCSYSAE